MYDERQTALVLNCCPSSGDPQQQSADAARHASVQTQYDDSDALSNQVEMVKLAPWKVEALSGTILLAPHGVPDVDEVCRHGVLYLYVVNGTGSGGITHEVGPDGRPVTC